MIASDIEQFQCTYWLFVWKVFCTPFVHFLRIFIVHSCTHHPSATVSISLCLSYLLCTHLSSSSHQSFFHSKISWASVHINLELRICLKCPCLRTNCSASPSTVLQCTACLLAQVCSEMIVSPCQGWFWIWLKTPWSIAWSTSVHFNLVVCLFIMRLLEFFIYA